MKRMIIFLLIVTGISSCTKTINVDLNSVPEKFVIEGVITTEAGGCRVLISKTKDFNTNNDFPGIAGALVKITDNNGIATILTETSAGVYEAPALIGISGFTYSLEVKIGNETFTASSTLPAKIGLDSLYITTDSWAGEIWKLANIEFRDLSTTGNSWLFKQYINGVKREEIYYLNDEFGNGNMQIFKLYMFTDTEEEDRLKTGDQVKVEMMCIDASMYKYWYSAAQSVTSHSQSGTPSNPVTNIKGGALGYFSAQTIDTRMVEVE